MSGQVKSGTLQYYSRILLNYHITILLCTVIITVLLSLLLNTILLLLSL